MPHLESIDALAFVLQECTFILSALRRSNQTSSGPFASLLINQLLKDSADEYYPKAQSDRKLRDEDHFLSGFVELRSLLMEIDDIKDMDVITLLQPYLIVIKSKSTSSSTMDSIVTSLSKLIKYGIINKHQHNIVPLLSQIVSSLCHCKFKGNDEIHDDILVIKIIHLLEKITTTSLGDILTDDSMYEILSTCFSLAINSRRKELLTDSAESALLSITSTAFSKLKNLESKPEIDHNVKNSQVEFIADSLPTDTIGGSVGTPIPEIESTEDSDENNLQVPLEADTSDEIDIQIDSDTTPFGIICLSQFLNHTVDILSPESKYRYTEGSRSLALQIMITIVEVAGVHLVNHPQLFSLISDDCCHHLVRSIQNVESPLITTYALKLFLYFAMNIPHYLKNQLELIFTTIFESVISDWGFLEKDLNDDEKIVFNNDKRMLLIFPSLTEPQIEDLKNKYDTGKSAYLKELFIETISVLWYRSPYFFINLFQTYDCDFERSDLTNSLLQLVCRLSASDSAFFTSTNITPLCMEGVLSFINSSYERVRVAKSDNIVISDEPNFLIDQYNKKSDFIECIKKWNEKPKLGVQALVEKDFIKDGNDNGEIAEFLFHNSGRLDKKQLGELFGKQTSAELFSKFIGLLDFKNLRPDESLRLLLNYFRLPGEAQQIDRIVDAFNTRYVECQDPESQETNDDSGEDEEKVLPDGDSMYVLSFSLIMLNTDLHNPNVKKPMSLEDYQRNLRGCYKGKDFPYWYTQKMYNSIKEKEIIMPEEHKGTSKWFETMWHSIVAEQESKSESIQLKNSFISDNGQSLDSLLQFDKVLFEKHFKKLLTSLIRMFHEATNDSVINKIISTIEKCAAIAIYFELDNIVNDIIEIITQLSAVNTFHKLDHSTDDRDNLAVVELILEDDVTIYASDLSIMVGKDYRVQLSIIVLFRVLKRYNYRVSKAWIHVIRLILKLFEHGLIDPNLFEDFQKKLNYESLKRPVGEYQINKSHGSKDIGLFSTFSSYLKGLSDDSHEPTQSDINQTNNCLEFIESTGVDTLLKQVTKTSNENLNKMVQILIALLPKKTKHNKRYFTEETLFLLEVITCYLLITKNAKLIDDVLTKCDEIINSNEKDLKMSAVSRVLSYKLLLLQVTPVASTVLLTETLVTIFELASKSKDSFIAHGKCILYPLEQLSLISESWCQMEIINIPQFWNILRIYSSSSSMTLQVFSFIQNIVLNHANLININNYMDVLGLLDEISAAGALGAQWEHECDKHLADGLKVDNIVNPFKDIVDIGIESIKLTSKLSDVINGEDFKKSIDLKNSTNEEVIISPWYPLIEALSHQCYNPCRELRAHAVSTLANTLINNKNLPLDELSKERIVEGNFRLILELLKPEVGSTDIKGMLKTQKDILNIVCKLILTYDLDNIDKWVEKVFAIASQMLENVHSNFSKSVSEVDVEVIESLKNVLLVKKGDLQLDKLKGYKMEKILKSLIEEVLNEGAV